MLLPPHTATSQYTVWVNAFITARLCTAHEDANVMFTLQCRYTPFGLNHSFLLRSALFTKMAMFVPWPIASSVNTVWLLRALHCVLLFVNYAYVLQAEWGHVKELYKRAWVLRRKYTTKCLSRYVDTVFDLVLSSYSHVWLMIVCTSSIHETVFQSWKKFRIDTGSPPHALGATGIA